MESDLTTAPTDFGNAFAIGRRESATDNTPVPTSAVEVVTSKVESTTLPVESATLPVENTSSAVESATSAVESTTPAVESATSAVESTTSAVESATSAVESTTSAVESTTSAVESTTSAEDTPPPESGTVDEEAGPSSCGAESNLPQTLFYVKQFQSTLKNEKQYIILQSVNGPCPLIAIINCLLLQHHIILPPECECITAASLCSLLGNYLLDRAQQGTQEEHHTEQYILDCLERFVQIQTGIDINVRFNSVEGFEYTPELSLFDLAQVRLVHGWVVDPQDTVLADLVADLTYNQLVEKTMNKSCSSDTKEVSESLILKDHLESSQLTVHGICEINSALNTGDLLVLFRNNHFSTITKQNGRLYVLVTDIGWAEESQVIWETLDSTCNSSSFVDGFFKYATPLPDNKASEERDEEYALSLELQISKEEQVEQQRLWDEAKLNSQQQNNEQTKAAEKPKQSRPPKDKSREREGKKSEGGGCSLM